LICVRPLVRQRRLFDRRRSLRWRVGQLAVVGVLLLLAQVTAQLVTGPTALRKTAEANRLTALHASVNDLRAAMDRQQASLFLYLGTGLPEFLASYTAGQGDADRQLHRLDSHLAGSASAPLIARVRDDTLSWRRWAEAERVGPPPGGVPVTELLEGQARFERLWSSESALESQVVTAQTRAVDEAAQAGFVAFITSVAGSAGVAVVVLGLAFRIIQLGIAPVVRLAATAHRIAQGEPARIEEAAGTDEIVELAGALAAWQEAAAERELVAREAPMGIIRLDPAGRAVSVNRAIELMYRLPALELLGRSMPELVHAKDRRLVEEAMREVHGGDLTSAVVEARGLRDDGSVVWCSITIGRLPDARGMTAGAIAVVEDISERRRQGEKAARIQRELWPQAPPVLPGYEVAGACLPAHEVAGDLYDWQTLPNGRLELTLADVMGKGVGPALVTATLRTALHAAPARLGPARKLAHAVRSMSLGLDEDNTYATVFHAQLDLPTGQLRYVDAGHGHILIRRADGELVTLTEKSLPLGVMPEAPFWEGSVRLEASDSLVAYSDGLVETGDPLLDERSFGDDLAEATNAEEVVWRMLGRMPARLPDDATALVLRRLPADGTQTRRRRSRSG
jgi:PAS domain S-box-containing protein